MACKQSLMTEGLIAKKNSPAAQRKALKSPFSSGCDKLWAEPVKKNPLLCVISLENVLFLVPSGQISWHSFISFHLFIILTCRSLVKLCKSRYQQQAAVARSLVAHHVVSGCFDPHLSSTAVFTPAQMNQTKEETVVCVSSLTSLLFCTSPFPVFFTWQKSGREKKRELFLKKRRNKKRKRWANEGTASPSSRTVKELPVSVSHTLEF